MRFQREAQVAARLSHPGICTVLDSGFHDGGAWIAMPLVEGRSLATVLSDGTPLHGVAIVENVARAVHAAHEAGVIHRDIKPANVMVRGTDDVVVCDLDLDQVREVRNTWQFYRDRRPDQYGPLVEP